MASTGTPAPMSSVVFGIRVNLDRAATGNLLLEVWRRVRAGGVRITQRGGVRPKTCPPLFLCSFGGGSVADRRVSGLLRTGKQDAPRNQRVPWKTAFPF